MRKLNNALGLAVSALALVLSPLEARAQQASGAVEIRGTATEGDDYICWSPVLSRVRLTSSATAPVEVTIATTTVSGGGKVEFAAYPGFIPSPTNLSTSSELELVLPDDGSWVPFIVAATDASTDGKDVSVTITANSTDIEIGAIDLMVRVRKNADDLTEIERERFLGALAALHGHQRPVGPSDRFEKYADAHGRAFQFGIHGGPNGLPLFLAWHRAFLLSLERELQEVDARVTLPFWRFDEDSSEIFQQEFLGRVSGGSSLVQFSNGNPLRGWRMGQGGAMVRDGNPTTKLQDVFQSVFFQELSSIMSTPGRDTYDGAVSGRGINGEIEARHHNYAHVAAGGWVTSGTSPRDPLFFLLHANVDRAWAEWQQMFDRFDASTESYPYLGSYPGPTDPARLRAGSYGDDVMWPWSQDGGASTPNDPLDDWPTAGFAFPKGFPNEDIDLEPTPVAMIDYLNKNGGSLPHNACYDGLEYKE